ncbi:MAG: ABC transporter ATP-binding protein [Candidatus Eiseniibacteriota bacterium]
MRALEDLSLEVHAGELFGFLGPNGAGKTTALRLFAGLLTPTSGEAFIGGHSMTREPLEAKESVGFVPDTPFLYEKLTGREFLAFMAGLFGVPKEEAAGRAAALLRLLELEAVADRLMETYSHGMRQKAALAGALVHDPPVVLLDEPTVGLDPRSARTIQDLLRALAAQGKTVFLSTHLLEVAEKLCDRVGILHQGRLLVIGTLAEIREQARSQASLEEIFLALTGGASDESLRAFLDQLRPGFDMAQ